MGNWADISYLNLLWVVPVVFVANEYNYDDDAGSSLCSFTCYCDMQKTTSLVMRTLRVLSGEGLALMWKITT